MTPPDPNPTRAGALAPLLSEMGWLSVLARELVRDPHAADDAVQETFARALAQPPDASRPVRGWLATVLRNVVRQRQRGERRRSEREEHVARGERLPSSSELASRVELQRKLAALVLELDEPQRSTVVLRFFENLAPREIARAQGVPLATVKARLQRGLATLRAQLDRAEGSDGRSWMLALAPLLRAPLAPPLPPAIPPAVESLPFAPAIHSTITASLNTGTASTTTGLASIVMNTKILAACALAALALVFVLLRPARDEPREVTAHVDSAPATLESPSSGAGTAPPAVSADEERAPAAEEHAPRDSGNEHAIAASVTLRGVAFDAEGGLLTDVSVRTEPQGEVVRTDALGRFEFAGTVRRTIVALDEPELVTVLAGGVDLASRDSIVVGARALEVAGRVVDTSGAPLAGAKITLALPRGFRGRFAVVTDESLEQQFDATARADGSFAFEQFPAVRGAELEIGHPGHRARRVPAPLAHEDALVVELEPVDATTSGLRGRVVDALGAPVERAIVAWGRNACTSGADGAFAFDDVPGDARTLVAVHRGQLPGRVSAGIGVNGGLAWPEPLVIVLGGPALSIRGRVEGPDGAPRANVRVWINGLEYLGERADGSGESGPAWVESTLRGVDDGWQPVRTDADGRFVIEGLCERAYHLTAMDDATVERVDRLDVEAGASNVVLRFPENGVFDEVSGRVVDRAGKGVAKVEVRVTTDAFEQRDLDGGVGVWHEIGSGATTDDDGRFTVKRMPRERAYLRFGGEGVLSTQVGQGDERWKHGTKDVVVTVVRRCHFQVQLREAELADQIEVYDRAGKRLDLVEFMGNGSVSSTSMPLSEGKSSTLATTDEARELRLLKGGKEVSRVVIELKPGELTVVKP